MNRRELLKRASLLLAGTAVLPLLTGCPVTQSQLAELVAEVGTGLSGILPYIKSVSTTLAATIQQSFQALETTVQGWQVGNAVSSIEQAVNAFVANMALIPALGQYQPLVALIVATAEGLITLLVPNATQNVSAKAGALYASARSQYPHPPKTARAFRGKWNAIAKAQGLDEVIIN